MIPNPYRFPVVKTVAEAKAILASGSGVGFIIQNIDSVPPEDLEELSQIIDGGERKTCVLNDDTTKHEA